MLNCWLFGIVILSCLTVLKKESYATVVNDLSPENYYKNAEIKIVDKLSTRNSTQYMTRLKKHSIATYKSLEITMETCWMSPDDKNNIATLLKVDEIIDSENNYSKNIFHGWIFANDQQVSNLEHPIYQIILLKCY